ncbi:MAG: glycosyltransferase [Candidatus Cloacimonadaceae bacterium]|jgi:hypothetical protein|nr:glycosyltransferase [Candidatus Cloacimonadota bacterium]MDD4791375.1 glycosyltransferase [Candidatus Cloacimonadota bacterium]MDY0382109.1 glycosyltransferase [Candidatus Cloacimonadaceae bacterium]
MSTKTGILQSKISIVITVYNHLNLLQKCFESILQQTVLPYEVILSDDGSSDDPRTLLQEFRKKFAGKAHYVRQDHEDFRAARVRNNGASVSGGDIIVFLDQDIVVPPLYLQSILEALKPGRFLSGYPVRLSQKQSGQLLARELVGVDHKEIVTEAQYKKICSQARKDFFYYFTASLRLPFCKGVKLRSGVSAMFKSDFERVNGFDESFVGWGNEDDNLGKRLRASGKVGYNFVKEHFPLHLYHEPYNARGERRNKEHARKMAQRITGTSFYCEKGLDNSRQDLFVDMGD